VPELWTTRLGTVPYGEALALQERVRQARRADLVPDVLLLLEHPPVYTRTRRTEDADLPRGVPWYAEHGIDVVETDRGGRLTYHGPGQLVGWPIMRVGEVEAFVRAMESAVVAALVDLGVPAHARPQDGPMYVGAWVEDRKIASIGIRVKGGVSKHGLAVNVTNDLAPFSWAVACGLDGVRMTSVAQEAPSLPADPLGAFADRLVVRFAEAVDRTPLAVTPERLAAATAAVSAAARDARAAGPPSAAR
jgi:lipoyl(octanoyl) transferase